MNEYLQPKEVARTVGQTRHSELCLTQSPASVWGQQINKDDRHTNAQRKHRKSHIPRCFCWVHKYVQGLGTRTSTTLTDLKHHCCRPISNLISTCCGQFQRKESFCSLFPTHVFSRVDPGTRDNPGPTLKSYPLPGEDLILARWPMASRNWSGPVKKKCYWPGLASDILKYPVIVFLLGQ